MSARRIGFRPSAESLETRWTPSTTGPFPTPANTISERIAEIRTARLAQVELAVQPQNLTPVKRSSVIGISAVRLPNSLVQPQIVGATNQLGERLPFHAGSPSLLLLHPQALGYATVRQPGPMTTQVTAIRGGGPALVSNYLPGDLNGDGVVNFADLNAFTKAYLATTKDANYNPAADANRNGYVGQGDAKFLLRNFPPLGPKRPLQVRLGLGPGQFEVGSRLKNSGGITRAINITVLGKTTPGSIVFADSGLGDYTFTGPVDYADANGNFSFHFKLKPDDRLFNTEYLILDPYGQQTIAAFPILLDR